MLTYLPINPDAGNQRNVIRVGGGSQVIEVRALAVNELTRDEIEVLLHITDRRDNKGELGNFDNFSCQRIVSPLKETDASDVNDKFGVELERYLTSQTELYLLQHSHHPVRDTVLKFIGPHLKDVKIALDREQGDPMDPKFFMMAHPSVPINNGGRWAAIHQGGLRDERIRVTYNEWLRSIGETPVEYQKTPAHTAGV